MVCAERLPKECRCNTSLCTGGKAGSGPPHGRHQHSPEALSCSMSWICWTRAETSSRPDSPAPPLPSRLPKWPTPRGNSLQGVQAQFGLAVEPSTALSTLCTESGQQSPMLYTAVWNIWRRGILQYAAGGRIDLEHCAPELDRPSPCNVPPMACCRLPWCTPPLLARPPTSCCWCCCCCCGTAG